MEAVTKLTLDGVLRDALGDDAQVAAISKALREAFVITPRPKKARRQYQSGSVYHRASDGRWVGTVEAGYTNAGSRRRITVSGKTEADAKAKLKAKQIELARGEETSTRLTVKTWADQWLTQRSVKDRPKTHTTDRGAVAYIIGAIGHRRLTDLTPADVRAVDQAVRTAGRSSSTVRRYRGTLERMLKAADAEGHPIAARVLAVEKPREAVNDRQAIPTPDVLSMLAVIETLPHRSRWVAAFLQGMRQGECLGLTWDRVDLEEQSLTVSWQLQQLPYNVTRDRSSGFRIPDGYEVRQLEGQTHLVRPKSKKGWRKYPLVPWMTQALTEWRDIAPASPHGLVWPALDGNPADAVDDREEWHGIQDAAGVQPIPPRYYHVHEARHSTAMLLLAMGVPESVRIQVMGHSSIASTRSYEHTDISIAREWLNQAAGRLQLSPGGSASTPGQ